MNASSRTARQIIKARKNETKAHRAGLHTLASHGRLAGLDESTASSVGGALRSKAKTLGVCGHTAVMVRYTPAGVKPVRNAKRYTKAQFLALAAAYNPRQPRLVAARELLLSY